MHPGGMTGDTVSLTALAGSQGGVLLTAQALEGGWPRRRLNRRLREESWARIHRGAWAEPGQAVNAEARLRAIQLQRPELVVSHRAAASLHDIELRVRRIELTGLGGGRPLPHAAVLHRLPLTADEITVLDGLRVTTVPRTLADLLRCGPRDEALVAVESAVSRRPSRAGPGSRRRELTSLGQVAAAIEAAPSMRGTKSARAWLALSDPQSGSPAETIARLRFHDAGLRPESQAPLIVPSTGRRICPDFLFRAEGLAVEVEGYKWHGSKAQHQNDTIRYNELTACPEVRRILRFTAIDVFDRAQWVIRTVRQALVELRAGA